MASINLVLATGNKPLNETLRKIEDYNVIGEVINKADLQKNAVYLEKMSSNKNHNVLLVSDNLQGDESLTDILFQIAGSLNVRIVYFSGPIDMNNEARVRALGNLVLMKVYDIISEKAINLQMVKDIINIPSDKKHTAFITKRVEELDEASLSNIHFEADVEEYFDPFTKINTITSIKPGSGKSFITANVAAAIAYYGKPTKNGTKPKVAVVEADLQNFSIGTILQIENKKNNLLTALKAIDSIIDSDGEVMGNGIEINEVNDKILKCFEKHAKVENLWALSGSNASFSEIGFVKDHHYAYLINAIIDDFDVILIDCTSNAEHAIYEPSIALAHNLLLVMTLDFNNIRTNTRRKNALKQKGYARKIKYIINEDVIISDGVVGEQFEETIFGPEDIDDEGFNVLSRIPQVPATVFNNRIFRGLPLVLDDEKAHPYIAPAKLELLQLANFIWPIPATAMDGFRPETHNISDNAGMDAEENEPPVKKGGLLGGFFKKGR